MAATKASLRSFLVTVFTLSFVLNFVWEMLQMPAYLEIADKSWRETAATCAAFSVGDAGLTLIIYGVGALLKRNSHWIMQGNWTNYLTASLLAALCAAIIEVLALSSGLWTYMDKMPLLPLLNIGLWPMLQLTLLVPLTLRFAACLLRYCSCLLS